MKLYMHWLPYSSSACRVPLLCSIFALQMRKVASLGERIHPLRLCYSSELRQWARRPTLGVRLELSAADINFSSLKNTSKSLVVMQIPLIVETSSITLGFQYVPYCNPCFLLLISMTAHKEAYISQVWIDTSKLQLHQFHSPYLVINEPAGLLVS